MRFLCLAALLTIGCVAQSVDLGPLTAAENQRALRPVEVHGRQLALTGVHRTLGSAASIRGAWSRTVQGEARLVIRSRGAAGLRLHVAGFDAGAGTLTLSAPGQPSQVYSGKGPFQDGDFWTETVFGEEVTLEYRGAGDMNFEIPEIAHSLPGGLFKNGGDAASPLRCHRDVTCSQEWAEQARSVANYLFEIPEGQVSCTGALVRTKSGSGVPYFATAHHCVSDEQTARSVETFWQFQTARCNGPAPALSQAERSRPSGARYVVARDASQGDFSLLVLNSFPPSARFANWSNQDAELGTPVAGIHHPRATHKRISFGEIFVNYWAFDKQSFPPDLYHQVRWNEGATDGGSSGSPLFTKDGSIIGMLSHGPFFSNVDICDQNPRVDGYARFSLAWPHFRPYLDDPPPSNLTVAPEALRIVIDNGIVAPASRQTLVVTTSSNDPIPVSVRSSDRWVEVNRRSGQARTGTPFTTEIQLLPEFLTQSGPARARLEVISGANGRPIPIDAEVVIRPSDVELEARATVDANAADDCRYAVAVALRERAGVNTAINGLRVNGEDYTGKVGDWFGGAALNASQSLSATLRICWPGVPAPYTFLFSGRDVFSGRTWTRQATVEFR